MIIRTTSVFNDDHLKDNVEKEQMKIPIFYGYFFKISLLTNWNKIKILFDLILFAYRH